MNDTGDAERRLTEHGIPPRDARALVRGMRRDVARMSNNLLPEVAYSAAPGLFLGGQRVLAEVLAEATRDMMSLENGIPAGPGMARYSVVPGIVLDPVTIAWIDHASRRRLGHMITSRPDPDYALRRYRESWEEAIDEGTAMRQAVPPAFRGRVSLLFYDAIARGIAGQEARVRAVEWTGWALLAVMMALRTHDDKVPFPEPGRDNLDDVYAQEAFGKGEALLVAGGLQLIYEAEREAA